MFLQQQRGARRVVAALQHQHQFARRHAGIGQRVEYREGAVQRAAGAQAGCQREPAPTRPRWTNI
ncbi:hypothetical protein [Chitiniphilus eburneus]|uniref:Uncharacterized protein n=1 Tax=Chitiniphilus eburneus TaxID=2571148 RepID=A0A4V5MMX5_9NEIS|nr:hypothetical protein [Chitiniphilus eburneus]TJZ62548.1 hypothetical protein FAZ21_19870 [Chitiniphilus eburneus]